MYFCSTAEIQSEWICVCDSLCMSAYFPVSVHGMSSCTCVCKYPLMQLACHPGFTTACCACNTQPQWSPAVSDTDRDLECHTHHQWLGRRACNPHTLLPISCAHEENWEEGTSHALGTVQNQWGKRLASIKTSLGPSEESTLPISRFIILGQGVKSNHK